MKPALIVIDMQNDYLYEKRKKKFSYDTPSLVSAVNQLISEYDKNNCDVIYIRHIIQNLPTNRFIFGYSIAGTEGAELYSRLDIVSQFFFDKLLSDALTNKGLLNLVCKREYEELHLCGLDKYGCVSATALGAAKRGITARIISSGTATVLPEKKASIMQAKLDEAGICFI